MVIKRKEKHKTLLLNVKNIACAFATQNLNNIKKRDRQNALQETVLERNSPELTIGQAKLKTKRFVLGILLS
jgi:hypothetical protein